MTRTERQKIAIKKWFNNKGNGILSLATGFGKTYTSCLLLTQLKKQNPNIKTIIGVPTDVLKKQWTKELTTFGVSENCEIYIFNTLCKLNLSTDLLILDELHGCASIQNINIFNNIKYKYFLGLTATFERLDGRHLLIEKYSKVIDEITTEEAVDNGWLSNYRNYKVLLDVDLTEYNEWNQKFQNLFSLFQFDFNLMLKCATNLHQASIYSRSTQYSPKQIKGFASACMKLMRNRKAFVMSHPKKFEVAEKIINSRKNSKIITFSATIKDANNLKKFGKVVHSKQKSKENAIIMNEFSNMDSGVLNTSKSCDSGIDLSGLTLGIILSGDSSKIRTVQRIGRSIRLQKNNLNGIAEVFTLVINNTVEEKWFNNSNDGQKYITINESQLEQILNNQELFIRPKIKEKDLEGRF